MATPATREAQEHPEADDGVVAYASYERHRTQGKYDPKNADRHHLLRGRDARQTASRPHHQSWYVDASLSWSQRKYPS
jgi:uncharacterized caspase-like protein